jgi:hypothetical protein
MPELPQMFRVRVYDKDNKAVAQDRFRMPVGSLKEVFGSLEFALEKRMDQKVTMEPSKLFAVVKLVIGKEEKTIVLEAV